MARINYEVRVYDSVEDFHNRLFLVLEVDISKASACVAGVEATETYPVVKVQSMDGEEIYIFGKID